MSGSLPTNSPGNGNAVTLREVYSLLKEVRSDLLLEIGQVKQHVDSKFSEHDSEHAEHEKQHLRDADHRERDEEKRRSLIRWAVTSLLSGAGVLVAIYVASKGGM